MTQTLLFQKQPACEGMERGQWKEKTKSSRSKQLPRKPESSRFSFLFPPPRRELFPHKPAQRKLGS